MTEKSPNAFRTISEVSDALEVPAHVLRFWESKFSQIKPVKRGGGRRYYRPTDLDLIRGIRDLLYSEGLTIKGVQKVLREKGAKHVIGVGSMDEVLWDEPTNDTLEQKRDIPIAKEEQLFEMAEDAAPAPAAPVQAKTASDIKELAKRTPEPDIRSLFDDPEPSAAAKQAVADDELIAKVAKIAEFEKGGLPKPEPEPEPEPVVEPEAVAEPTPEPVIEAAPEPLPEPEIEAAPEPEAEPAPEVAEIKSILSKLENLRDRMKAD